MLANLLLIMLCLIGYSIMGTAAGILYIRYSHNFVEGADTDKLILFTVLWPAFLGIAVLVAPSFLALYLVKRLWHSRGDGQ